MEKARRLNPQAATYPSIQARLERGNPHLLQNVQPPLEDHNKAIVLNPYYWRHYLAAADTARREGDYPSAVRYQIKAVELVPNSLPLRNRLAVILIEGKQPELALRVLDKAIPLAENPALAYRSYYLAGAAYDAMGQRDKAVQMASLSLYRAPNSPICWQIYQQLKRAAPESLGWYDEGECTYR